MIGAEYGSQTSVACIVINDLKGSTENQANNDPRKRARPELINDVDEPSSVDGMVNCKRFFDEVSS